MTHARAVRAADDVADMVALGRLELIAVDQPIWDAALTWCRRFDDQRFSFVDGTSFAIMHERGINDVLSGDRHFAVAGFVPLGV